MPYRVDFHAVGDDAFDRVVALGAIDVDVSSDGRMAALMPDAVTPARVADALGVADIAVSPAVGRDDGSVWVLGPRSIRVGRLRIVPAHANADPDPDALTLVDSNAFGTGLHPTTALCLEALEQAVDVAVPPAVLDVGTGSGILALAALKMGVPRALAVDIDDEALRVAAENARINGLEDRLQLTRGGPEAVTGQWPLVMANVLAAPLIEMAPALVRRVAHQGELVLSGIPVSAQNEVDRAFRDRGMRHLGATSRGGWVALVLRASW